MKKLFIILFIGCLVGCSSMEESYKEQKKNLEIKNQKMLSSGGTIVGTLPDGRKVRMYNIEHTYSYHTIYVVDNTDSISSNYHANKQTNTVSVVGGK